MPVSFAQRSHSADPVQEALREHKASWNKRCSEFIARVNTFKPLLIAFKRGLNGRGDAKAGLPISNIKNPFPPEVFKFLNGVNSEFHELVNTFEQLSSEAASIIQEQSQYANKRKKSQKQQIISSNNIEDILIVEASNPLTRFWSHLSALFSSKENKHLRLSMLSIAHAMFKNLINFEDLILEKGTNNVPQVINAYFLLNNNLNSLNASLNKFKNMANMPNQTSENIEKQNLNPPSQNIDEKLEKKPELNNIVKNLFKEIVLFDKILNLSSENMFILKELCNSFVTEKNTNKKELILDRINEHSNILKKEIKKKVEERVGQKLKDDISFDDLKIILKNSSFNSDELEKFGANYFTRLLKQYQHQFGKKDPASASRLEIYNHIRQAKIATDKLMDLLERTNVDVNELINQISEIEKIFNIINEPLKLLNILNKDRFYQKDHKYKSVSIDPINRLFTQQLRKDVDTTDW